MAKQLSFGNPVCLTNPVRVAGVLNVRCHARLCRFQSDLRNELDGEPLTNLLLLRHGSRAFTDVTLSEFRLANVTSAPVRSPWYADEPIRREAAFADTLTFSPECNWFTTPSKTYCRTRGFTARSATATRCPIGKHSGRLLVCLGFLLSTL